MTRLHRPPPAKGALELIEEAVHLLRTAPPGLLASYYLGTLPFAFALLYFWAEMSRSPDAEHHLAGGAFVLALLFIWMKGCQAAFTRHMRAWVAATPPSSLSRRSWVHLWASQASLHSSGLFLIPLAFILVVPFPWVYAFYQNLTALAEHDSVGVRQLIKTATRQAVRWPTQNVAVLAILLGFGFCVFLNWSTFGFFLPGLVKMLLGIESSFTRSGLGLLNTTFFAAIFSLTWLCVDPVVKTVYVLRCFYGASVHSGEDLKVELKQLSLPVRKLAAGLVLLAVLVGAQSPRAAEPAPATPPPAVAAPELDRTIAEVIQQRKYSWRMPREEVTTPAQRGIIGRFMDRANAMLRKWIRGFVQWLAEWIRKLFDTRRTSSAGGSGYGWMLSLQLLMYLLVGLVVSALIFLLYRWFRSQTSPKLTIATQPITLAPDLSNENVAADQLPEDGWTQLARELLARGELRLALRAFYLASLAHLAARKLITLAKFKSNRDYELELRRRAHSFPNLLQLFNENVSIFDRIWYGLHEVNAELVNRFAQNVEQLKTGGAQTV